MTHKHVFYVALLYIQLRSLTRTWTQAKSGSGCSAVWSSDSRGIVTSRHHLGAASSASPAACSAMFRCFVWHESDVAGSQTSGFLLKTFIWC